MKKILVLFFICVPLLFIGCSSKNKHKFIQPKSQTPNVLEVKRAAQEQLKEEATIHNYVKNLVLNAYIGEAFIYAKKSIDEVMRKNTMIQDQNFTVHCPKLFDSKIFFTKDDIFEVQGSLYFNNQQCIAIHNPKMGRSLKIALASNGSPLVLLENTFGIFYIPTCESGIEPKSIKFYEGEKIETSRTTIKNIMSYELIYTGKTTDSLMITYREYTGDDMARPAFFQNLTYSLKQKQIRFKNLLIEVISADNEKIVFKVLED